MSAAWALGILKAEAALPSLVALLKDKNQDAGVRESAAQALGVLKAKAALSSLIAALKDESVGVRRSAAEALWQLAEDIFV
jgi:HEAT repeat protein